MNRLIAQLGAKQYPDVETQARDLVGRFPHSGYAWLILGVALQNQDKDSLAALKKAASLLPTDAEAHCSLGVTLEKSGRFQEAVACYQQALRLDPRSVNALCNLGNTQKRVGRFEEAVDSYVRALAIDPVHYKANLNLKAVYFQLGRLKDAEELCRRTLAIKPDFAEMRHELTMTLAYLSDFKEVVAESNRAFEIKPDQALMWEQRLYSFSYHSDLSAEEIFSEFVRWGDRFPDPSVVFSTHDRNPNRRLRIGYVSPDFRKHSSRFYFWPLFANHDRNAFELFAYSNVEHEVAWTRLFKGQFDHWRDIRKVDDEAAARLIREDRIDILVDLCNHMKDDRLGVFALKPAPVQATWLGAAWTTGLKAVDYVLFDPYLAPEGTLARESILRLPQTFLAYRPREETPELAPAPCLRNGYITFGYSGRTERLNHHVFTAWGEILRSLPEARLILDYLPFADPKTQAYYRSFLAAHGVDVGRVVFRNSPDISVGLNDIDILLDSFPHSGGTMLMDALWMGVPALVLASRPPLGRIGTSFMMNLGLPDWVATSEADFVRKACQMAKSPQALNTLRLGLRDRMKASPLMDGPAFSRAVEAAYRTMFGHWIEDASHESR